MRVISTSGTGHVTDAGFLRRKPYDPSLRQASAHDYMMWGHWASRTMLRWSDNRNLRPGGSVYC